MQSKSTHVIYHMYIYIHIWYLTTVSLFWVKHPKMMSIDLSVVGQGMLREFLEPCTKFCTRLKIHLLVCADSKGQIVNLDALITSYIITIYHNIQPENLKDSCFWLFFTMKEKTHLTQSTDGPGAKWSGQLGWPQRRTSGGPHWHCKVVSITVFKKGSNILELS